MSAHQNQSIIDIDGVKSNSPLFSVLIANYNNGQYLEECLQSVYKQTYTNWEIVIVDDGTTDSVSKKIYTTLKDNPKIRVFFNKKNMGCGYTKRRCVAEAKGTICGFLDPDDTITATAIEVMIKTHLQYPNISLAYSKHYVCDENLEIKMSQSYSRQIPNHLSHLIFPGISHFATFKLSYYKKTSGINPNIKRAVDQDLYLKLEEVGKTLFINKFMYYYRQHSSGISTHGNELKAEYWSWLTKIDAARRRNIDLEDAFKAFYSERFKGQRQQILNTNNYKLGKFILSPIRQIKKILNDLHRNNRP